MTPCGKVENTASITTTTGDDDDNSILLIDDDESDNAIDSSDSISLQKGAV